MNYTELFMRKTIELATNNVHAGLGGPFGALIVKNNQIIAEGTNSVTSKNDPTAHAEVEAIRNACTHLKTFQLSGCTLYTSCEPCPMCLGAIYWARPDKVYFGNTKAEAAAISFDDQFIYDQINILPANRNIPFIHLPLENALEAFILWDKQKDLERY